MKNIFITVLVAIFVATFYANAFSDTANAVSGKIVMIRVEGAGNFYFLKDDKGREIFLCGVGDAKDDHSKKWITQAEDSNETITIIGNIIKDSDGYSFADGKYELASQRSASNENVNNTSNQEIQSGKFSVYNFQLGNNIESVIEKCEKNSYGILIYYDDKFYSNMEFDGNKRVITSEINEINKEEFGSPKIFIDNRKISRSLFGDPFNNIPGWKYDDEQFRKIDDMIMDGKLSETTIDFVDIYINDKADLRTYFSDYVNDEMFCMKIYPRSKKIYQAIGETFLKRYGKPKVAKNKNNLLSNLIWRYNNTYVLFPNVDIAGNNFDFTRTESGIFLYDVDALNKILDKGMNEINEMNKRNDEKAYEGI